MSQELRLVAVGDVHPNNAHPEGTFAEVEKYMKGDLRYCQLECTMSEKGQLRTDVRNPAHRVASSNIAALTAAKFDVISFASNNAMDFGVDAFMDTIQQLRTRGIQVIGAGQDLIEARKSAILEKNGTKIGFVNFSSILPPGYAATQRAPGISPLRVHTYYEPLENIYEQPGSPPKTVTAADQDELDVVLDIIRQTKKQVDVLVGCFHWGVHFTHDLAMYQPEVAYAAIDAGVDIILGTHPHCLQAFDVYKGKVIAYSLGNFVFEQEPFSKKGVGEYLSFYGIPIDTMSPRYPHPAHTKLNLILSVDITKKGVQRVAFRPSMVGKDLRPRALGREEKEFKEIANLVESLSQELGTKLEQEGDEFVVSNKKEKEIDARTLLRRRKMSYPSLRWLATQVQ